MLSSGWAPESRVCSWTFCSTPIETSRSAAACRAFWRSYHPIYRSAYELFYTAVAPAEKRAVTPVIDVGMERLGDAVGGGMVSLLLVVAPGRYGAILTAACVCSTIALLLAMRLHGRSCVHFFVVCGNRVDIVWEVE